MPSMVFGVFLRAIYTFKTLNCTVAYGLRGDFRLPSAKCTRPLFQGRTGCGGRPSGWHDIVTCHSLVYLLFMAALFSGPGNGGSRKFYTWWTLSVVREVTTWIFSWSSLNYREGQKVTKFGVFSDHTRKRFALTLESGRIL